MEWSDDKLRYRYTTRDDLPRIIEMLSDPEVGRYLWFTPATPESIETYFHPRIDAQIEALARGELPESAELVVHDRESGAFLGQGAVVTVQGSPGGFEIGYQMPRASWGKGNGRRLARFLTAYAVFRCSAHRIQAGTLAGNEASIAILEGLGLKQEARLREYRLLRGRRWDELIYGAPVAELDSEEIRRWAAAAGLI
jgi:RimJ/RimL family protein N-acetyltransferase